VIAFPESRASADFDRHTDLREVKVHAGNATGLIRVSLAIQASIGPIENEWLRDNLVAIAQLAESLDRSSFELAMRIVPIDRWAAQLPRRTPTAAT
jgi:hypothetical protein